jgi:outer membrane protein TolC
MNLNQPQCHDVPRLTSPLPVGDGAALLRRRPDIRQAERNLAAATARIGVSIADLYPHVSFGISAGSSGLLDHFGAGNAFHWNLGPLISWNFPSAGARSRVSAAEASAEGALAHFDAVVLNALKEAESALIIYAREKTEMPHCRPPVTKVSGRHSRYAICLKVAGQIFCLYWMQIAAPPHQKRH